MSWSIYYAISSLCYDSALFLYVVSLLRYCIIVLPYVVSSLCFGHTLLLYAITDLGCPKITLGDILLRYLVLILRFVALTLHYVLVWFLLNVSVNNFSVMLGQSHHFLGIYQYFGELKVSCTRTLHGGRGVRTLDLSLRSPTLYH